MDEALKKFKEFKSLVENHNNHKIKSVKIDCGDRHLVMDFIHFLHLMALSHRSQSLNKLKWHFKALEPLWKWLVVCCIIIRWSLSSGQKQCYVQLIINQIPTQDVQRMDPFEKWYGYKPYVVHFEVFGSHAQAHIPKEKCKKLQPTSQHHILVGCNGLQRHISCMIDPPIR